jgi:glycerophosphoryl diester phosphodiesterase
MNILLDVSARSVIAHRGNRAHAPENTIEAMREAVALGADALEFDLRVTRDGVLVLLHDALVDRTTNGAGAVERLTLAEVKSLDAGFCFSTDHDRTFPWRGRGVTVPTFDELAETVRELPLIIELKTPAATELTRNAIARHGMAHRVVVAGFESRAIHPLRGAGFALGATSRDAMALLPRAFMRRRAAPLQFQTVNIPPTWNGLPVPFRLLSRSLRASGIPIHVWTVNEAQEARRLWRAGVSGIISDDPAVIIEARTSMHDIVNR